MHPDFTGISTIQECRKRYSEMEADDHCEILDRKRKNAVVELLRFVATKENPVNIGGRNPTLSSIY